MKEYRKVISFKHKNNKYNMYLDDNNRRFFLKINHDGNLYYVTVNELMELSKLFFHDSFIMDATGDFLRKKIKIVPKVINSGLAVTLSLSMLTSCISAYNEEEIDKETPVLIGEDNFKNYISNADVIPQENLKVDTYVESEEFHYIKIYDMDYLNKVMAENLVSKDDLYNVINNNNKINQKFKDLLYEYCNSLLNKYSNIELRVLYENLKTLEINEVTDEQIGIISHPGSLGCYDRINNKLYMLDYYTYEVGSWQYEIFFHEMSHCLRTRIDKTSKTDIIIQAEGDNFSNNISMEALNSLFAVSLLSYKEDNITYQLQSNYFDVMIECMDNYDLSDYVNHSISYFADKLDDYNNDENYATVILELMQAQYDDFHNPKIEVEQSEYYPIYDYISSMYFNKYIDENMTYEEMKKVADALVLKISTNTQENYNIDYNRFYENLDEYCLNRNITQKNISK